MSVRLDTYADNWRCRICAQHEPHYHVEFNPDERWYDERRREWRVGKERSFDHGFDVRDGDHGR